MKVEIKSNKVIISRLSREYFKTVSTMMISAMGLVAALAWNDLIKRVIDHYISPGSSVLSQLIYVVIITTLLVLVTMELGKVSQRFKEDDDQ